MMFLAEVATEACSGSDWPTAVMVVGGMFAAAALVWAMNR